MAGPTHVLPRAAHHDMPHVEGVEHRDVIVGGIRLHVAEAGAGDPLVLLHGWPQHWWHWRHVIGPLAERYRVIAPDWRGLGWSEVAGSGYSVWDLRDEFLGVLDALGLDRVRLVGQDWGNLVGYLAGFEQPERVERFVALGGIHPWSATGGGARVWLAPWHIYLLASPAGTALARAGALPAFVLRYWRSRGTYTRDEIETYLTRMRRPATAAITHQRYTSILLREVPYFLREHKRLRLTVPTLALDGDADPLTEGVPDSWRRFADDMRWVTLPGVGHFPAEEAPAETTDHILEFLEA
jgi:pimeloyl-ACP methyl ester carboxylesterase